MLFNSLVFILVFLPTVVFSWFTMWHLAKKSTNWAGIAKVFLLCSSLFFYAYFQPSYLLIIVASIVVNQIFALGFRKLSGRYTFQKKLLLVAAIAFNLGIIGYYKYWDFFATNVNGWIKTSLPIINVMLPLGISFFTFQQLSYIVDCYKTPEEMKYNILDYALFVCYFPQLIAGPIVTHDEIVPQFQSMDNKHFSTESFSKGLYTFTVGLAKKVLIADVFGNAVNVGFNNVAGLNSISAILVMLGYTFQIYFDFSGYCDMATGCALMMNIQLPMNFNSPYKALSIREFWNRWHITLTRFFTKYIYIPLGGNRKGMARTCLNVLIVYLCSGIWHGANWTFVLWGGMHGVACIIDRLTNRITERWHPTVRWLMTFLFVNVTWVYFRAESIGQANLLLSKILYWQAGGPSEELMACFMHPMFKTFLYLARADYWNVWTVAMKHATVFFYLFAGWITLNTRNTLECAQTFKPSISNVVQTVILFCMAFIAMSGVSTFLYFNF